MKNLPLEEQITGTPIYNIIILLNFVCNNNNDMMLDSGVKLMFSILMTLQN